MNVFRKVMAVLILIFFGLPILFGVIWAVGITKTAVSPEFVTELPQEIIAEVPDIVNEVFRDARDDDVIADPNTRAWFEAAAKVDMSPKEVMARTGLLAWLDHELSDFLEDIGEILRGKRRARTLIFDLRPLKEALTHPIFFAYIEEVLNNLPPCDDYEQEEWERSAWRGRDLFSFPACRPDIETSEEIIGDIREEVLYEIPDDVEVFDGFRFAPFGISRVVTWLSYSLFVLPAIFIFLAALIAATSPASFFRWSGISVLIGGAGPLLISLLTRQVTRWIVFIRPYSDSWSSDLQHLIAEKTEWIQLAVIDHLFSPVITVAGVVCVLGIFLIAISLIVSSRHPSRTVTQATEPVPQAAAPPVTQPNEEPTPESESSPQETKEEDKT